MTRNPNNSANKLSATRIELQGSNSQNLVEGAMQDLRRIFKVVESYSRSAEQDLGITGPQLWTIWELGRRPGSGLKDLAVAMHLSPSTMVGMVDRLLAKGLVRRETDPADRRRIRLDLTAEGESLLHKAPDPAQERLIHGLQSLSPAQLKGFRRSLQSVVKAMDAEHLKVPFFFADE